MTDFQDYMNTHKIYPDDISRRIDIAPGFDSVRDVNYTHETGATRPTVKESLTTALDENGLARCGCGGRGNLDFAEHPYADKGYFIECESCGIIISGRETHKVAAKTWNTAMGVKEADE